MEEVAAAAARRRAWVLTIGYIAVIFAVSSIPGAILRVPQFRLSDKVAHIAEYTVLGFLLAGAIRRVLRPHRMRRWHCWTQTGLTWRCWI